jgi:hypothetical protein
MEISEWTYPFTLMFTLVSAAVAFAWVHIWYLAVIALVAYVVVGVSHEVR